MPPQRAGAPPNAARRRPAEDRATAAAHERVVAALERDAARAERAELLRQLAAAESGALTAARSRGAGMGDLEREVARYARQSSTVVVAAVGVVGATVFGGGHAENEALTQPRGRGHRLPVARL